MVNLPSSSTHKVWIFDLDDTLHDASSQIFPKLNRAMTKYIMEHLKMEESAAHSLRQHYWNIYGATLKGLIRHHGVDGHHFLAQTHVLDDLAEMVVRIRQLRHMLMRLPGRKVVFTNAPRHYALRVLKLMGITDIFDEIFSVESTKFHPKPALRGFQGLLKIIGRPAHECIMVEDSLPALQTAKRLRMKTIYISKKHYKPNYVDSRINNVLALNRVRV